MKKDRSIFFRYCMPPTIPTPKIDNLSGAYRFSRYYYFAFARTKFIRVYKSIRLNGMEFRRKFFPINMTRKVSSFKLYLRPGRNSFATLFKFEVSNNFVQENIAIHVVRLPTCLSFGWRWKLKGVKCFSEQRYCGSQVLRRPEFQIFRSTLVHDSSKKTI